jgi:hypothetical protein
MRRRRLRLDSFIRGMKRDSATDEDRLLSLRTMKNYFIDYTDGRLKVRNGYSRWNDNEMVATATQLFWFGDLDGNEHLLGILDDATHNGQWYKIAETGGHTRFDTQLATSPQPMIQVKNRVFYGTDSGAATARFMWTDNVAIAGATSYRVGIARSSPLFPTNITSTSVSGHVDSEDFAEEMDTSDARKIAIQYDVGAVDEKIQGINTWVKLTTNTSKDGTWTCRVYTDNSGEPSTTLVQDEAVSFPLKVIDWATSFAWELFSFKAEVTLPANTTVWFEYSADDDYYANFKLESYLWPFI